MHKSGESSQFHWHNKLFTHLVASYQKCWTEKTRKEMQNKFLLTTRLNQIWLGVWSEKLINQAYTLGLPSMNCFLLSPPTTISDPNMGTMTARAENVAATILSSVSRRPINIWIKRKKHNQMNVQRRKTDPLRLVECEAKSEKSEKNGFGPILAHSTTLNRDGEILPDHRQKHRKIQLRSTFIQRCLFKFTSMSAKNYTFRLG